MLLSTPALALLLATPVSWVLTTEEHVIEVKYYEQGSIHNGSNRFWIGTLPFTLYDNKPCNITGSAIQDPPEWAAWLRPSPWQQTNFASDTVLAQSIPPGQALYYGFEWDRESGLQGWSPGGDLELEIFRSCDKHTNPVIRYVVQ